MFGKLFRSSEPEPADGAFFTLRVPAPLMPIERGEVLEDPLQAILSQSGLGSVTGGGTQLDEHGNVAFCDVEICLDDAAPRHLEALKTALQMNGVPNGAVLIDDSDGSEMLLEGRDGLSIAIDGATLPDEVYEQCDLEGLLNGFGASLGDGVTYYGLRTTESHTTLFYFGGAHADMRAKIADFLASYPLCKNAIVTDI